MAAGKIVALVALGLILSFFVVSIIALAIGLGVGLGTNDDDTSVGFGDGFGDGSGDGSVTDGGGDGGSDGGSDGTGGGANDPTGYWLFSKDIDSGSTTATYSDSQICMFSGTPLPPGCISGVICLPVGLQRFRILSDGTWTYRSNVKTGSDFNNSGRWRILAGTDIIEWTFKRSWSCAHPPKKGEEGSLDVNYLRYSRFLKRGDGTIEMWRFNTWSSTNPPQNHTDHAAITLFKPITATDYDGRYGQDNYCQGCTCVCCGSGCASGTASCDLGCVVTCQKSDNTCLCSCPTECASSHYMPSCSGKRGDVPTFEELFFI